MGIIDVMNELILFSSFLSDFISKLIMSAIRDKLLEAHGSLIENNSAPMIYSFFNNCLSMLLLVNIITPSSEVLKKSILLSTHEIITKLSVCSILTNLMASIKP